MVRDPREPSSGRFRGWKYQALRLHSKRFPRASMEGTQSRSVLSTLEFGCKGSILLQQLGWNGQDLVTAAAAIAVDAANTQLHLLRRVVSSFS